MISWSIFDFAKKKSELEQLEKQAEDPALWDDPSRAQQVMKKLANLREEVQEWEKLEKRIADLLDLAQMEDESLLPEIEQEWMTCEGYWNRRN